MADINLQRFIDIDIKYHEQTAVVSTRDTVVYIEAGSLDRTYAKLSEVLEDADASAAFKAWATVFFNNNGGKIHHVPGAATAALVKTLADEEIVVCIPDYDTAETVAQDLATDVAVYGIKQKIILTSAAAIKTSTTKNLVVKYSATAADSATIAGYLSCINFYENDTVKDYCFTEESVTAQTNDDTLLSQILTNNMNVDMTVAQKVINLGGNMKDGRDLVNNYSLIVLQQLLTTRLMGLLITKIKGSIGLSEIQSTVADEMQNFLDNGYLTTDKIWRDEDLVVSKNGKQYTIISKNEPLTLGYKFVTLPLQSLTDSEKLARTAPDMYLIVADSYGIRKVTIKGEVI